MDRRRGHDGSSVATAPAQEAGWRAARRLLHGSLRTLVAGQLLGEVGDGLAQVAFAQFVVFEVGRGATPARIATLLAVTLLPFSIVGPFAGILIDRWSRRRVLVVMSWVRAGLTLTAVATVVTRSEGAAYVGVLLLLSTSRFVLAAKGAVLPRTVHPSELVTANAISALGGMVGVFTGAVAGTAFVGRSAAAGFVVASACYLSAGAVFGRLPDVGGGDGRHVLRRLRETLVDLADGLRATGDPAVGVPLTAVWLHRLLLGAGFVLLVLVADSRFHLGISGYGLALGVTGVSALAGSLLAPVAARRWSALALLPVTFLPPAAALYVGGTAPSLLVLVAGMGATALAFQLLKTLADALVGRAAPDAVRGRVFSVYDVLYNVAFVLAGLLMVPLWDPADVRGLLWWLGAAYLLGWALYARLLHAWPFPGRPRAPVPPRRWRGRVSALVLGALPVLALPAVAWWWWAWVALVPTLLLVRAAPTSREAAMRGWWAGTGFIGAAVYWLAPVTGPAVALVAFGIGLLWLPWGWAVRPLLGGRPRLRTLLAATVVLPSGWVAIEAVRSWASLGGPWALIGTTQWNQPATMSSAALGGVWLTGFLVVAVNVAVAAVLVAIRGRDRAVLAGVAVAALAVGPVWAAVRPAPPSAGAERVAVVQPGVMGEARARLDREIRMTETVAARRPGLVVWAESSVGYDLPGRPDLVRELVALTRRTGADLLVNVDARRGNGRIYKTSILVTPAGLDGRYEKMRLVPFGEYVPLRPLLGWVSDVSRAARENRGRGTAQVVLRAGRLPFGPLVCFESAFPDMTRREVALGARLLVFQTATTTFQGSWAQPQHAALAAVRAVESGRPAVHAALTGTSAAFDATGHRLLWIPAGQRAATVLTVTPTVGRTPYDVAGDWVLALAAVVLAAALAVGSVSPRTGGTESPPR
jgi:apolipoprotein N-acyltransferase